MCGLFAVILGLCLAIEGFAESHLLGIKIAVTNPAAVSLGSERIVIGIDRLRKITPGLHRGTLIISITDAATELQDIEAAPAETHDQTMLATAERVSDYVLNNLLEDGVPGYDFDDEGVHFRNRDSSAAPILACGLLRLSELTADKQKAERYSRVSQHIMTSLLDRYLPRDGTLPHGSSRRRGDGPLIYGPYFLLEALMTLDGVSK